MATNVDELQPHQLLWENWVQGKLKNGIDVTGEVADKIMAIINSKREGFTTELLDKALNEVKQNG